MTADFLMEKERTAREVADQIVRERKGIIGIMMVRGSVTVGYAKPGDIYLFVITEKERGSEKRACNGDIVDVEYVPIEYTHYASHLDYDILAWRLCTGRIIYDSGRRLSKLQKRLQEYPIKERKRSFTYHFASAVRFCVYTKSMLRKGDRYGANARLYLAALRFWYCLFPFNSSYRRENMPVLSQTTDFQRKPPRFEEQIKSVMGFPQSLQELQSRIILMRELIREIGIIASKEFVGLG